MTREHDDKRVTDAYRDLATERAPASLDKQVLAMASREARTRYGLARAWIRPVAWAATIGLTVAVVLEVSRYTDVADVAPEPEMQTVSPAAPAGSDAEAKRRGPERFEADLGKRADPASPADSAAQPEAARTDAARPEAARPKATQSLDSDAVARELAADEVPLARQAEEQARMREGEARAVPVIADQPLAAAAIEKQEVASCDNGTRESAQRWYACIENLREAGLDDAAAEELDALRRAFPEFREPGAE